MLADRDFNVPAPIDMLIGASIFYDILNPEQKRMGAIQHILQNTEFGWIISGALPINKNINRTKCNHSLNKVNLENQLENFWHTQRQVILNDFYVDDLITGADTAEDAKNLKFEINKILEEYGFFLRKWSSNKSNILESDNSANQYYVNDGDIKRALGIVWHARADLLTYSVRDINTCNIPNTKRGI